MRTYTKGINGFKTMTFDQFTLVEENRPIDWNRVESMSEGMKIKNLTRIYPVAVNSKEHGKNVFGECDGTQFPVIDGQHRYLACHMSDTEMNFVIDDEITVDDIPAAAIFQKSWKLPDYLNFYCKRGKSEYRAFAGYIDRTGFSPATSLVILCGDRTRHTTAKFKAGDLNIALPWSEANKFAECINKMGKYLPFARHSRFVEAFREVFDTEDYSHSRLMSKLDYLSSQFRRCPDKKSYLEEFEKLYNYNQQEKTYFINKN